MSRKLISIGLFFLGTCLLGADISTPGSVQQVSSVVLDIKSQKVSVKGPLIYLKDIAEIKGDSGIVNNLSKISLLSAAPPGKSVAISLKQIEGILLRKGIDVQSLLFKGQDQVTVTTNSTVISYHYFTNSIEEYILNRDDVKAANEKITLELLPNDRTPDIIIPEGEVSFKPNGEVNTHNREISLPVQILVDGIVCKNLFVTFKVHRWADVAITKKKLELHQIIGVDDFLVEQRDLNQFGGDVVIQPEMLVGKQIVKNIAQGKIILKGMVDFPPVVKKGETVSIEAHLNGVYIKALGEAQEDGKMGDSIHVLNVDSKKEVKAVVIGEGQVAVGSRN